MTATLTLVGPIGLTSPLSRIQVTPSACSKSRINPCYSDWVPISLREMLKSPSSRPPKSAPRFSSSLETTRNMACRLGTSTSRRSPPSLKVTSFLTSPILPLGNTSKSAAVMTHNLQTSSRHSLSSSSSCNRYAARSSLAVCVGPMSRSSPGDYREQKEKEKALI